MIKPIDVVTEIIGDDEQTRFRYAIGDFLELEQGTRPRQLYDFWRRLPREQHGLPHERNCGPRDAFPAACGVMGSWIETRAEDPLNFVMREHEPNEFPGYGTELSDQPLSGFPDSLHAFSCAAEYLFCKSDREPVYHEIRQVTGGIRRHYTRIMLPVAGDYGKVVRVHYAVRRIMTPQRIDSSERHREHT